MTKLGTMQSDGSLLLYDENIEFREAMTGRYRRVRQTTKQRIWLAENGYTAVVSSFISGIGTNNDDLFVRFLNGSVYIYYGFASKFDDMLEANSKGQFFNKKIRPTKKYEKVDSLPMPSNLGEDALLLTDEELFKAMDVDYLKKVASTLIGAELFVDTVIKDGMPFYDYQIIHNDNILKIFIPLIPKN